MRRSWGVRDTDDESAGPWISPVLSALTIPFMMGYDHYFEDDNGRAARALFYWSMLKSADSFGTSLASVGMSGHQCRILWESRRILVEPALRRGCVVSSMPIL